MNNLLAKLGTFSVAFLLIISAVNVSAQIRDVRTSAGTDFIFSFMPNHSTPSNLTLFVSSDYEASGVVDIPRLGSTIAFTVQPNLVTSVEVPVSMANLPRGVKSHFGIRVTSDVPINLYALNQERATTDAFLVLPIHALGKEYMAAAYRSFSATYPSQIAIVGTQDNTQVRFTSPVATTTGAAGVQQVITLNKMETFLVASSGGQIDISGTTIESDKPVAVTSGVRCANIPVNTTYCDHVVEMMPPVHAWGNSFITYPLARRTRGDLIRVMASTDNTEVKVNDTLVATLHAGAFYEAILTTSNVIETTRPAIVTQYSLGQSYDGVVSDPFMMLVPPTEQFLSKYTFSTPESGFTYHFANVVIRTSFLETLLLDGIAPDLTAFKPIGDGSFSGGQIAIVAGSHFISAQSPFGLYVYGFGTHDSYGYPGGMSTEVINPINGDYKNVRVTSRLRTGNIDLDLSSFIVAPEKIEYSDDVITIEWFFPEFSIGQIKNLDYEVVAKNLLPGEKRIITNSLDLSYQDLNGVEHKRTLAQQELTVLSSGFTIGVATDKPEYGANQAVTISTQLANAGPVNSLVSVTLEIQDANGNYVAGVNTTPDFVLGANSSLVLSSQYFSTANTYSGNYRVHAILKNQDGSVVAENRAAFAIVDSDAMQMAAQVTTDKLAYTRRDTVNIVDRLTSLSANQLIQDVTVITRILHEAGEVLWYSSSSLAQLTPGAFETFGHAVPLTDAELGNYTVHLTAVNTDGVLLASDQSSFQVQINPLFTLSGSVTVAKDELPLGEGLSCTYTLHNTNTQAIAGQVIKLSLVRVDEAASLFSVEQSVDLTAQGQQSFTPSLPLLTTQGDFACVLEAVVSGQATVLASALFTVKSALSKLNGDIVVGEKSRLLVLVDKSRSPDEINYLRYLLDGSGWFYTIVTTAKEFDAELRNGGYGVYALLSEGVTLTPKTRESLKAEIALGDGLLVANGHDRRHQSLEDALGIRVHAKRPHIDGISVDASELGDARVHIFDNTIRALTFDLRDASVIGSYIFSSVQGEPSQALGSASDFNVFVLEDFTSLSSTVEGRIAVGGNFNLQNFSVGDKLDAGASRNVVVVDGNVVFPSGRIYHGNLIAGGSVAGVGDPVRYGMAPGATIRGNTEIPVDFASENDFLQELSTSIAALPANGTVEMRWGGLELTGDCNSQQQVFTVKADELAIAHTFTVSCIPEDATVIFNVPGQNVTIQNIGMQSLSPIREKVLFNFPDAETLSLKSVAVEGSILAPHALVDQPAGRVEGQVVVKAWHSTNWGYMSIHNHTFKGDLSAVIWPKSQYALAIHQYQQGKTVFAGFDVLAHSVANQSEATDVFGDLLLAALEYVNPLPDARGGKVVPVVVTATNVGSQTASGQALLTLSDNLIVVQAPGFTEIPDSTSWVAPLDLPSGTDIDHTLYVQLPISGSAAIQIQLQTGTSPDWTTQYEESLIFSVD